MEKSCLATPPEFSFELCLQFLKRSPREILHVIEEETVIKLLKVQGQSVLFRVSEEGNGLQITFLNGKTSTKVIEEVAQYVTEWFDLTTDLKPFYKMAKEDSLLKDLAKKYYGYRIIGQPDLFESLIWAVLGQQINLQFAYTLKQRFVEQFGESLEVKDKKYFLFPLAEQVAEMKPEQLLDLQFSKQKANYTIGIAKAFTEGVMSKDKLIGLSLLQAKEELIKIKGIGNWTANYALMKTFRYPDAFPLEDAGVHNAIKKLKSMKSKPTLDQVKRIFKKYKGWEAYATLYLWKSL